MRLALLSTITLLAAGVAAPAEGPRQAPDLGGVRRPYASLRPVATFAIGKTADWVQPAADAVWIGMTGPDGVVRIDARRNRITDRLRLPGEPCAGLAAGFGRLWVPL